MSFGKRLKEARKAKGLEAQYVAKKLNVAKSTYSGYENDKTKPSFEILQEMSKLLQVSTDYLLGADYQPLSTKSQKDVSKTLEELKNDLESQSGLLFSGGELDEETREFLLASLERTIRQSKVLAKEKFTPHKYKK